MPTLLPGECVCFDGILCAWNSGKSSSGFFWWSHNSNVPHHFTSIRFGIHFGNSVFNVCRKNYPVILGNTLLEGVVCLRGAFTSSHYFDRCHLCSVNRICLHVAATRNKVILLSAVRGTAAIKSSMNDSKPGRAIIFILIFVAHFLPTAKQWQPLPVRPFWQLSICIIE